MMITSFDNVIFSYVGCEKVEIFGMVLKKDVRNT